MIVIVDRAGVRLQDSEVFDDFHVELTDGIDAHTALERSGAGRMSGEEAIISIDWLTAQRRPSDENNEVWLGNFAAMTAFANSRGWVLDDGRSLRAHVVRS